MLQVGEVGELSEIFQWRREVPPGLPDWSAEGKEHLEEELYDVLLCFVRLADVCNVNLGEAALEKLRKNASKYPFDAIKRSYDGPLTAFNNDAGKTTADTNRKLPIA
ncbi:hypothetical protein KP509_32G051400 [Ceratopteris richardii]|uniref:dCTP pyrophosphatase 1 n=1 Tax=Ceratopteris richardii TaxID=49495 RepID=A0A8T2QVA1_CERRI|nr:hypothetical protein KP509_32G051400 [Ceratopteris richardii]